MTDQQPTPPAPTPAPVPQEPAGWKQVLTEVLVIASPFVIAATVAAVDAGARYIDRKRKRRRQVQKSTPVDQVRAKATPVEKTSCGRIIDVEYKVLK